ncbi:MAG: hypothetical protein DMG78_25830 [Acidobacteria bacterium]|nr:MAG: hypothetical protein DMG78_25830 [Acidobacteriota bacterium]
MSPAPVDPWPHADFADSPDPAAWIGHRRMAWEPQAGYRVGNEVPQGYATYLRILHRSSLPGMPEEAVLDALVTGFERGGDTWTTACWFAYWKGWGALEANLQALTGRTTWTSVVEEQGAFTLGDRDYVLMSGPLAAVLRRPDPPTPTLSPQLWWPEDGHWFVATDIDFHFSLVGADEHLAAVISEQEGIDVQQVAWEDRLNMPPGPGRPTPTAGSSI